MSEEVERQRIARTVAAIAKATGVRPVGWHTRSSASPNTRRLLIEEGGFLYDSDAYNDDLPYTLAYRRAPPCRAALRVRHQRHAVPEHQPFSRRRGFRRLRPRGVRLAASRGRERAEDDVGRTASAHDRPPRPHRRAGPHPGAMRAKAASGSRAATKSRGTGWRGCRTRKERRAPACIVNPNTTRE